MDNENNVDNELFENNAYEAPALVDLGDYTELTKGVGPALLDFFVALD
ncbi:hypothetical protein GCM10020358_60840 [Amorphoplanes nipponensis]|uniref:Uncharacterized protein n=1 Tax=Actinoplanes nipponensis TaxID=135950 RepID=A0A919JPJ4_9ACTN|nr:lasso RiPP family leader peptide-containing protein [Actinoplanes nipponensis]GIE54431.1 hypothetical protein Ani05nite_79650 [Actinoplanes nipponensis]